MFLCDTWLRYLKKLQFMLTETRQISNSSQDVSKETLSDLVKKSVAKFSDKFFHFQYATLEMFKGALNNYAMLKLLFNQHPPFWNVLKNVSHQYYATNQEAKSHILLQNFPPNRGRAMSSFFICHSLFYYAAFFPSKDKLKYIIIHFRYEISNDII